MPGRRCRPPALLPPAPMPPSERVSSAGMEVDQVVRLMLVAYKEAGRGEHMRRLTTYAAGPWWGVIREMALRLIEESISPTHYVRFVCRESARRRGRFPFPAQVFAIKSLEGWIASYRSAWAIPVAPYVPSEERRRAHAEAVFARLRI